LLLPAAAAAAAGQSLNLIPVVQPLGGSFSSDCKTDCTCMPDVLTWQCWRCIGLDRLTVHVSMNHHWQGRSLSWSLRLRGINGITCSYCRGGRYRPLSGFGTSALSEEISRRCRMQNSPVSTSPRWCWAVQYCFIGPAVMLGM
jgi:hypothetical protein